MSELVPAIEVRELTKTYPGVVALDHVSLTIKAGECHALMGENGAGKSTLGKILAGLIPCDGGEILLFGEPVRFHSPVDAAKAGLSIVHQELVAFDNMTVEENLAMESIPHVGPFVNFGTMREEASAWLKAVQSNIDPATRLGDLPTSQQQVVLIAGAVARGAKVVIFDEATSSLSSREAEVLFDQIEQLKSKGVTCIYVSHRMDEIFRLCDSVSVLRDGKHIGTRSTKEIDREQLVQMMIGRAIEHTDRSWIPRGETQLEVSGLTSPANSRMWASL